MLDRNSSEAVVDASECRYIVLVMVWIRGRRVAGNESGVSYLLSEYVVTMHNEVRDE